jgi:hypothetical protein
MSILANIDLITIVTVASSFKVLKQLNVRVPIEMGSLC